MRDASDGRAPSIGAADDERANVARRVGEVYRHAQLASAAYLKHCLQPSSEMLRISANKYGPWLFAQKHFVWAERVRDSP